MFNVTEIVTHDGQFHADEVAAVAILRDLMPHADIIRTRDRSMTAPAPGRIVCDVGERFDPELGLFDHHQRGAPVRAGDDGRQRARTASADR